VVVKRWVWRILWGTSLLLSIGTVVLWGRSYFRAYCIGRFFGSGDAANGEEREIFGVSNRGWFFLATNWEQFHYETNFERHDTGNKWTSFSIPPPDNYKPPAYFPINYHRPDGGYGRSSGFDARVVSAVHFIFHSRYKGDQTTRATWAMTVPHWLVALILLWLPGVRLWQGMKVRRVRRFVDTGRCVKCGYDMRATPGKCPEWGAICGEAMGEAPMPR